MITSQHCQINALIAMDGNFYYPRISPDDGSDLGQGVYIAQNNAELLPDMLEEDHMMFNIFIVPFLEGSLGSYELLDYQTNIEIIDGPTHAVPFPKKHRLPKEIRDLKPIFYVNRNDFSAYINYLKNFFAQMRTMRFKHDKAARKIYEQNQMVYYEFY